MLYDEKTPRILSTPSFYAYLKIAEGCSNLCTFCTVPKIRGAYRSRGIRSVLEEARKLADQGVREIILIAQDTTAYGNLEKLLKGLIKVEGLHWIRILYSYPRILYSYPKAQPQASQSPSTIVCTYLDLYKHIVIILS
jgi:ribosomal protein S12 methylthiotransferase